MELIWFLLIGLVAGWLAGKLVKRPGSGWVEDLIVGVIGADRWVPLRPGRGAYRRAGGAAGLGDCRGGDLAVLAEENPETLTVAQNPTDTDAGHANSTDIDFIPSIPVHLQERTHGQSCHGV